MAIVDAPLRGCVAERRGVPPLPFCSCAVAPPRGAGNAETPPLLQLRCCPSPQAGRGVGQPPSTAARPLPPRAGEEVLRWFRWVPIMVLVIPGTRTTRRGKAAALLLLGVVVLGGAVAVGVWSQRGGGEESVDGGPRRARSTDPPRPIRQGDATPISAIREAILLEGQEAMGLEALLEEFAKLCQSS